MSGESNSKNTQTIPLSEDSDYYDEELEEYNSVFSTETYPIDDYEPNKFRLSDITNKIKIQSSSFLKSYNKIRLEPLPPLEKCKYLFIYRVFSSLNEELLIKKIEQCQVMFDFSNPIFDLNGKEVKRTTLKELSDFTHASYYNYYTPPVYEAFFKMFEENLFRIFPSFVDIENEIDDEEFYFEISWPHISIVYEIFENILCSTHFDPTFAMPYVNESFLINIIELFNTKDKRERNYLTNILHSLYSKFFNMRTYLRECIGVVFYQFIYENTFSHGISALLEIYSSIIHGFATPIKEEHVNFLKRRILPLHTGRSLHLYHQQLQSSVLLFIVKEEKLGLIILEYLFRKIPKTPSISRVTLYGLLHKILVLTEIQKIVTSLTEDTLVLCMDRFFEFISRLILDEHYQVSERALSFARFLFSTMHTRFDSEMVKKMQLSVQKASIKHWSKY
ncbi:hypothetical protein HZS_7966 [Henneguya salminicola]|nr:hypothetical protein HZS_7966 [Henneguya salminicola]